MNYSLAEILVALGAAFGFIKASVPALKWLKEQVKDYREKQKARQNEQLYETAEMRRVGIETDAAEWERMSKMNNLLSDKVARNDAEAALRQEKFTNFNIAFRRIGRNISRLESKIFRAFEPQDAPAELAKNMEEVKTDYEAAEKLLL